MWCSERQLHELESIYGALTSWMRNGHVHRYLYMVTSVPEISNAITSIRKNLNIEIDEYEPHITLYTALVRLRTNASTRLTNRDTIRALERPATVLSNAVLTAEKVIILGVDHKLVCAIEFRGATLHDDMMFQGGVRLLKSAFLQAVAPDARSVPDLARYGYHDPVPLTSDVAMRKYDIDGDIVAHITLFKMADCDGNKELFQRRVRQADAALKSHHLSYSIDPEHVRLTFREAQRNYILADAVNIFSEIAATSAATSAATNVATCKITSQGKLIGKEGATITRLRKETGCDIHVEHGRVTVTGSREHVVNAKIAIEQLLSPEQIKWH